jgi:hypothetical protein
VVPCSVNLLDPNADVDRVIAAARASAAELGVPVVLVVIDTISRSFGSGDENGPDMVGFVASLDKIRDELGAHVLGVHHTGKDEDRGLRGHYSLTGAPDTIIKVSADEATGLRVAKVEKGRDVPRDTVFPFRLKVVQLGVDEDGDPVTSCIVDADVEAPAADPRAELTPDERSALSVLVDLVASEGRYEVGTPIGGRVVTLEEWRARFYALKPGVKQDTKRKAFSRASSELIAAKLVYCIDPYVWPASEAD